MSRSSAAVRFQTRAPRPKGPRLHATLGELIAAAYEAAGPGADVEAVKRILEAPEIGEGLRPRFEFG